MPVTPYPTVFFPIEISTREYPGHLLLATELADRGFVSVIGHKGPVGRLMRFYDAPAVLFYKGDLREVYAHKNIAVGQDPEAGIVFDDFEEFYVRRPFSLQRLDTSKAYFCYGPDDHEFLTGRHSELADKIYPTGSPRVELWGPAGARFFDRQVEEIRVRYGEFVLIASSGGRGNPIALKELQQDRNGPNAERIREKLATDERRARLLATCARRITDDPGVNVVVRPHPAESWKRWKKDAASIPRLYVDSAYDLNAWVRAAAVVIQNSSTTAFEAWFAGTPVIAYGESSGDILGGDAQGRTPNRIALPVTGEEDLVETLANVEARWDRHRSKQEPRNVIERKVYPPGSGSVQAIADVLVDLVQGAPPPVIPRLGYEQRVRSFAAGLWERRAGRERLGRRRPPPTKRWPLTVDRVGRDVEAASEILGLKRAVAVKRVAPSAFVVGGPL